MASKSPMVCWPGQASLSFETWVRATLSQYIASRSGVGIGGSWSKTSRSETDMLAWAPCRRPARSCGFDVIVENERPSRGRETVLIWQLVGGKKWDTTSSPRSDYLKEVSKGCEMPRAAHCLDGLRYLL